MDLDQRRHYMIVWWAKRNEKVREIWLFGSRARGTAKPDSDIDLAITFVATNWTPTYFSLVDKWQREIAALVGAKINLQPFPKLTEEARQDAILLWSRD